MFRPVKTRKIYEEIVEQIKKLIIDGRLQPGDKLLSERELSEKLNVSRASVREAFSALEMMGIISIRPGEGSFVKQVSYEGMLEPLAFLLKVEAEDVVKLQEVRKILEVEAAALAALRATPDDIAAMQGALEAMQEQIQNGELGDLADAAFHFAVARAANNPVLNQVMLTISDLMTNTFRPPRQRLFLLENMSEDIYRSHCEIFQSIQARDAEGARHKMNEHLNRVEEAMEGLKSKAPLPLRLEDRSSALS